MQRVADLLKNKCCVFVGAGIPNVLGFPLWKELASDLINFVWSKKDTLSNKEFPISMKQELESRVERSAYCYYLL